MKAELTSLDLHYLQNDLKKLVGFRIDKIYQEKDRFLFTGYSAQHGKQLLRLTLPSLLYLAQHKETFPTTPTGFCMFLRKHLSNATIQNIQQYQFQRVLKLEFLKRDRTYMLIIELFSDGNIILCDQDMKIMYPHKTQIWKDRAIRGGVPYVFPAADLNSKTITQKVFDEIFTKHKKSISGFLAKELSFGKDYAAEICTKAKVDPKKQVLTETERKKVFDSLKNIFKQPYKPYITTAQFFSFALQTRDPLKLFSSLSELLDDQFGSALAQQEYVAQQKAQDKQVGKYAKIVHAQETILVSLEKGFVQNQRKGELIYEHYQELKDLLAEIQLCKKKQTWKELIKKYEHHPLIKKMDEKTGKITFILGDG